MKKYILLFFLLMFCGCGRDLPEAEAQVEAAPEPTPDVPAAVEAAPAVFDFGVYPEVSVGMEGLHSAVDAVAQQIALTLGISLVAVNIGDYEVAMLSSMEYSGTLPDIVRVDVTSAYFAQWVERGSVRAWRVDELDEFPLLQRLFENSDELRAVARLHGGRDWFMPLSPGHTADSGRVYVRQDWLHRLGLDEPDTLIDFMDMLEAFAAHDKPGLSVAGGVTYIISLFGTDPQSWVWEDGEWIPAYYSYEMLRGLQFVRGLYQNGWLDQAFYFTKANAAIQKMAVGEAGSLIRQGDGFWLSRSLSAFADANDLPVQQVWDDYIAIIPPPAAPFYIFEENGEESDEPIFQTEWRRHWPRAVERLGIAVPSNIDDEQFLRVCQLLSFIASADSRDLAYFGIEGQTSLKDTDGQTRLLIDPSTARPYDIVRRYPAAQALFLLGRSPMGEQYSHIPGALPPGVKLAGRAASYQYDNYAIDEGDGFLARFIHTPAKSIWDAEVDYNTAFNDMVMGSEPVEDMFEAFRQECERQHIRVVIEQVNTRMAEAGVGVSVEVGVLPGVVVFPGE